MFTSILGDPGADNGGEGKSKRAPEICDLVYLVSVVSQWPIDMRQNVRDQESQVSMAWPRVVIRDLKQGRRRRQ